MILVPTRELAQQVAEALTPYARSLRLTVVTVVGGRSIGGQARALRGGKSQAQRSRTLELLKAGEVTALVATNVAACGLHVDDLGLVVCVDPPGMPKDYLHRGGRTARAGGAGTVVTLVLPHQRRAVAPLMARAGITPHPGTRDPGDGEPAAPGLHTCGNDKI